MDRPRKDNIWRCACPSETGGHHNIGNITQRVKVLVLTSSQLAARSSRQRNSYSLGLGEARKTQYLQWTLRGEGDCNPAIRALLLYATVIRTSPSNDLLGRESCRILLLGKGKVHLTPAGMVPRIRIYTTMVRPQRDGCACRRRLERSLYRKARFRLCQDNTKVE